MLKFILIIIFSFLFVGCINEVGDGSSIISAPSEEEMGENDEESDGDTKTPITCNDNGACEVGETYLNCFSDCPRPDEDRVQLGPGQDNDFNDGNTLKILGCMLEDAPNYDPEANSPCTTSCLGDKIGENCCCED